MNGTNRNRLHPEANEQNEDAMPRPRFVMRFSENTFSLGRTRRRTQAGLTPGKDDSEAWRRADRKSLKGSA